MQARSLAEALNLIMKQRGWTQMTLARVLGVSQVWVSLASRGKRDPGIARTSRYLDRVGWEVRICPKDEDHDPVKRREFVTAVASVTFVPSASVGPYQNPQFVRGLTRRLSGSYYDYGGDLFAADTVRHLARLEPVVGGIDRKLQAAAADFACAAVWPLRDARWFDAGERAGRLAVACARRTGDRDGLSRAYEVLSATNHDRGRIDRAAMYARRGVEISDVSPIQQWWMKLRLGRDLGRVRGRERAARDLLADVRGFVGEARGSGRLSEFWAGDMLLGTAVGFTAVRAFDDAQATLRQAARLAGERSPLIGTRCVAQQAVAALRAGDPNLAADRMVALSRALPLVSSARVQQDVAEIEKASAKWKDVPEMRAARVHLRAALPRPARPTS